MNGEYTITLGDMGYILNPKTMQQEHFVITGSRARGIEIYHNGILQKYESANPSKRMKFESAESFLYRTLTDEQKAAVWKMMKIDRSVERVRAKDQERNRIYEKLKNIFGLQKRKSSALLVCLGVTRDLLQEWIFKK